MAVPADQFPPEADYAEPTEYLDEEEEENSPLFVFLEKGNIVAELKDNGATTTKILELYDEAERTMGPWLKKYEKAINLAKLQPTENGVDITEKDFPFEGASLAMLPFILEAMIDFNSRAAPELAWADKLVHAKTYGKDTKEKEERAVRVADYSNNQVAEGMSNWRSEQDKALMNLPCSGTFYKQSYFDYEEQEVRSDLYLADKVIFNHDYKTFEEAPDKFIPLTLTRNQVLGFIRGEQEWDLAEDDLEEDKEDFEYIKAYTWIDLDDDGLKEPYIATIDVESSKIVHLYPYYDDDTVVMNNDKVVKVKDINCLTQYRYMPDPEGGPMGMGWGILLGSMFEDINTNLRQLLDAGTLHITASNSGLISKNMASGRGNAVDDAPISIVMGELTPIESHGSGSLRDNIVTLPFSGPSSTLFQLLQYLIDSARSLTNASVNIEAQPGEAATLYLAKLQQALKKPNVVIMRVTDCQKAEFKKIGLLNHRHFDDEKYNKVLDLEQQASMEHDFNPDDLDIVMVADPSQGSDIERIQRAQAIYEMSKDPTNPQQVLNFRQAVLNLLEAMNTTDIESLAPEPDPNAKNPQEEMQQQLIAQQMADMELKKKDQDLRAEENKMKQLRITMEQQKQAMQAAKDMGELGIKNDELEAKTQRLYVQSLKDLVEMGLSIGQAMNQIEGVESTFIDSEAPGMMPPMAQPMPEQTLQPDPPPELPPQEAPIL